jgi:hypothetical protein
LATEGHAEDLVVRSARALAAKAQGDVGTSQAPDHASRQRVARVVVDAVVRVVTARADRLDPPPPRSRPLDEAERATVTEAVALLVALTSSGPH